jgi:hypothetical protein
VSVRYGSNSEAQIEWKNGDKRCDYKQLTMVESSPEKAALPITTQADSSLSVGDSDQVVRRLTAELARDRGCTTGRYAQATPVKIPEGLGGTAEDRQR